VHDELVLEVRADAAESVAATLRQRMTTAGELRVPLRVDIGVGANWDKSH